MCLIFQTKELEVLIKRFKSSKKASISLLPFVWSLNKSLIKA